MKNSNFISIGTNFFPALFFLFLLAISCHTANAQSFCQTKGGPGAIGIINNGQGFTSQVDGPFFLKIYVHAVGKDDGSDAPTVAQIKESISILSKDFNEHNIFFVWDCNIIPINSTTLYDAGDGIQCDLSQYSNHPDGIDIFIGSDDAPLYGAADNIPGKFFIIKGSFSSTDGTCTGIEWINSRSKFISHEMGHCLGLWHTHHDDVEGQFEGCDGNPIDPLACEEFVDESNNATCGDYVTDTPADPGLQPCVIKGNCTWDFPWSKDPNDHKYKPDETLIMSYSHPDCMKKHSIKQGVRMRQMILISPILQACLVNPDFVGQTVNTNTTWTTANMPNNGNFLIVNDLVIEGGATLTINSGVTVHFGEQGRLIIKPNARLVLNGTLTGVGCHGNTWQGVKVWGSSPNQSQYAVGGVRAQGRIECRPGSLIENAKVGIQLYGPTYALAGGQISCSGAIIKNCLIGVEFAPYQNFWPYSVPAGQQGQPRDYFGSFSTTTFLTNEDYPHKNPFYAFVHMTGVNGIRLSGCSYTNARTIKGGSIVDWGYGIFATDAGFSVFATGVGNTYPPSSYISSEFNNLGYGIYTANTMGNRPYSVEQSNFDGCFVGLYNKGVSAGVTLFNTFKLGKVPSATIIPITPLGSPTQQDQVGAMFENAISGFTFEENDFLKVSGNVTNTVGSICKNTGTFNNVVRKNRYTGISHGNVANDNNAVDASPPRGLYYLCNENTSVSTHDFLVTNGGIRNRQGVFVSFDLLTNTYVYDAAGNRFSYFPGTTQSDFKNSGMGLTYYYDDDPNKPNQEPLDVSTGFNKLDADGNDCLSSYCKPPCKSDTELEQIKSDYYTDHSIWQGLKADYALAPTPQKAEGIAFRQSRMDGAAYMVVLHELHDTLDFSLDTLRKWVGNMHSLESDLWLATDYVRTGETNAATTLLNAAPAKYQLDIEDQGMLNAFKSVLDLLSGIPVDALDETTRNGLSTYAASEGYAAGLAQNILTWYGGHYPPAYMLYASEERDNKPAGSTNGMDRKVIVIPNPSNGPVALRFILPNAAQSASLRISDVNGRLVQGFDALASNGEVNMTFAASGMYFYQLMVDGLLVESGKIVIQR